VTRIYLVRHAESTHNKDGLALGRADVPLTDTGHWQAARLADALSEARLAAVYSSPLERAMDTAWSIASRHDLEVSVEDDFIEMDIGVLDGLPFNQVQEKYPDLMQQWMGAAAPDLWMPGGERLRDVAQRAWDKLGAVSQVHVDQDIAVVTHNFVILSLLTASIGLDLAEFRRLRQSVAAYSVLEAQGGRLVVTTLNDTCHLRRTVEQ
jgi:broad specificity phosphatase PhoE